ncbi:fungal-specific transcription factor domain-containing protein [Xylogone sp. PMI_703]|nr:fungal-specific transcription factor domain-containing protein [Xylogone sp. PMI_703]
MLSNPLHRFSAYNALPPNNLMSNGHLPPSHMHPTGLENMGHGSQYAMQQLQHLDVNAQHRNGNGKHRQHPYAAAVPAAHGGRAANGATGPIRRRISRACDQCNQLRTKCDGQNPCAHCVEFGLGCEYVRERKKRGKASRKDLAAQAAAAAAAAATSANGGEQKLASPSSASASGGKSPSESRNENPSSTNSLANDNPEFSRPESKPLNLNTPGLEKPAPPAASRMRAGSLDSLAEHQPHLMRASEDTINREQMESPASLNLNGYSNMHGYRPAMPSHMMNGAGAPGQQSYSAGLGNLPGYTDLQYGIQTQSPNYPAATPGGGFRLGDSPLPGFPMGNESASPGWMSLSPPSNQYAHHVTGSHHNFNAPLRYPVLQPLLPHLGNIIPVSLACDLLELYFASSSSALMHPTSPYVLGYVFRKQSFLHPTKPRQCTPALLASMLWVVAQTSDASFLTAPPSARGRICQRLLELTVGLLKPLIHGPPATDASPNFANTVINGVALGGLGVGSVNADGLSNDTGAFGAAGALDDVVTYIHLATVVSASEYKGASLRWWNAAWSLARELKLNRELPQNAPSMQPAPAGGNEVDADGEAEDVPTTPGAITEEEREERRRIWWLVYIVDRHLALCYNRPLFLLDVECEGLLQPMDDTLWQAGEFYTGDSSIHITSPSGKPRIRRRGPNFECTGHSIFGYFLPLMTILGEIVDLYHAKNHPRFGIGFRSAQEWDDHASEIARQLDAYGQSLKDFEERNLSTLAAEEQSEQQNADGPNPDGQPHNDMNTPSVHSVHTSTSTRMSESDIQTRIVAAYGTHVMHVLHILLTGKWDPISLLDDNDLWISSQSFINATGHAVSAAEAINNILEYDPGLEFMPFFFGVYLLQGSFLLLLIADKLQVEASPSVVKACETIVRAHEACVVTLNTEYQRNFRKVMRSALAQVKGRVPEDFGEQQLRRREVLALYRWTGDGTGLAL